MKLSCLVYDIEIEKAIEPDLSKRIPGIQYCDGWDDKKSMGVSVLCAWDCLTERPLVYFKEDLEEFTALVKERELLVGFNHTRFDNEVLRYNIGPTCYDAIACARNYDLLIEGWLAAGLSVNKFTNAHKGFKLDDFAFANLGVGKTGNGALAPVWWQQGKKSRTINYCLADIQLTKDLFYKILSDGFLKHPSGDGRMLRFRKPLENITGTLAVSSGSAARIAYDSAKTARQERAYQPTKAVAPTLVPEVQPPLFEGIPDKVIGWHKAAEVKPEGGDKSGHELRESEEVDF